MAVEALPSAWGVVSAFALFLAGAVWHGWFGRQLLTERKLVWKIYLWHSTLCLVYCWYVLTFGGDARSYYVWAETPRAEFVPGTPMVAWIVRNIRLATGTSFVGVFAVFNTVGSIALLLLHDSLAPLARPDQPHLRKLIMAVVFLPSVSFWSSGIGKDAIAFLAVCLLLWSCRHRVLRWPQALIAASLMALVRPHMAALMVGALLASVIGVPQGGLVRRLLYGMGLGAVVVVGLPWVLDYLGLSEPDDLEQIGAYIDQRQQYNQTGQGAIDISEMSVPLQIVSYLFRPLPFEARSLFGLMASIEGLLLIHLAVQGARASLLDRSSNLPGSRLVLWLYAAAGSYILASTTANLGISLRQKWMVLPPLLFLLLSAIGSGRKQESVVSPRLARTTSGATQAAVAYSRAPEPSAPGGHWSGHAQPSRPS